jgi:PAS domain S-box-containing protein
MARSGRRRSAMGRRRTRAPRASTTAVPAPGVPVPLSVATAIPDKGPRAALQELLRKAVDDWQLTFDAIESPIILLEGSGIIRRLNRAAQKLSGKHHYRDLIGRPVEAIGPGEPWARASEVVWLIRRSRLPTVVQAQDTASRRTWELSATLIEGDPLGHERIILIARDITHTVQLQTSLRRSEMMSALGSLVAGVAHEVRNPLFSISATLDAFEARFGPDADHARYIAVLRTELERLSQLMKELLDYGKPRNPDLQPGSVVEVVDDAVRLCARLSRSRRVRVLNHAKGPYGAVPMDRSRLLEVFQNLVENAIQHSPPGGTVTVSGEELEEDGRRLIACTIHDTGPGFREEDLPKLFEPFFTRRRGGTGLGLSIVQRIVEQHGGVVSAANSPDGGALMRVRLPVAVPAGARLTGP